MAAGLGFKTFTTGEVLTAADTNGYLMQGILVFATEAARNSAITSPQEGQFAFTKDTNSTWFYDGAAWVASGASGDVTGVTAGNGISVTSPTGPVPTVAIDTAVTVDKTTAQTLTNKTLTSPALTTPTISTATTNGDILYGTGSGALQRLGIGSAAQVLTVASGIPSWATPASGGGMTLLSTTSLSGSSTTISSISGSYTNLWIYVKGAVNSNDDVSLRFNGISTSGFYSDSSIIYNGTVSGNTATAGQITLTDISSNTTWSNKFSANIEVLRYTDTSLTDFNYQARGFDGSIRTFRYNFARFNSAAAISSVTFFTSGSSFTAGTVYIYGVN